MKKKYFEGHHWPTRDFLRELRKKYASKHIHQVSCDPKMDEEGVMMSAHFPGTPKFDGIGGRVGDFVDFSGKKKINLF